MNRLQLFSLHILASIIFLVVSLSVLFSSSGLIQDILLKPHVYFATDFSDAEIILAIVFLSLVVIVVLVSYIFYLLLTFNTRFEFQIWNALKPLAASQEEFRRLYDSAPVPYVMLDNNGEIQEPNKAALRFFEVVPEDIQGKNFFSYFSEEKKQDAEKFLQHYKSHIGINRKEVEMVTKSGAVRSALLTIFDMKSADNQKKTGLAIVVDITEQKLLDKTKTEFVSLASHQLRAPLATAKWYTEMLMSGGIGELTSKQSDYIARLHSANEDMIELVNLLLNVSRVEMGSLSIDLEQVNVETIAESILQEFAVQIEQKNINLLKEYNGHLQNIRTDSKLLRIVIQNLVSNSVKYTGDGGTITISFEEVMGDRRIIVSDTGVGIPQSQQDRIFTKLFRADNVRTLNDTQGTGLGLYLVKSIITSIGGSIAFVSEENKGTTFTISL